MDDGRLNIVFGGSASGFNQAKDEVKDGLNEVKTGVSELSRKLDSSVKETGNAVTTTFEDVERAINQTFDKIDAVAGQLKTEIASLESEYNELGKAIDYSYRTGRNNDEAFRAAERRREIEREIRTRKLLLSEVGKDSEALVVEEQNLKKLKAASDKTTESQNSLRKRMRQMTMQLVEMEAAGERGSEAYQKLQAEAGKLRDAFSDAQKQVQIMAHDNAGLQGVISAVSGVAGAFSAAQGVIGLFTDKNEELQKVMLKVQSLMSITMGLQQVANTLNKDSYLNVAILQRIRAAYNAELNKGVPFLAATTVAQTAENAAANAGTVANTGLAASFRAVGAAIKSVPVIGWIIAAISALVAVISLFNKKSKEQIEQEQREQEALEKSKEKYESYKNAVSNAVGSVVGKYKVLQKQYKSLSSDLEKRKWVDDNAKSFRDMGLAINDVNSAESAFVDNTELVLTALKTRAEAQALQTMYQQEYAKKVAAQVEADKLLKEASERSIDTSGGARGWRDDWKKAGLIATADVTSHTITNSTNYGSVSSTTYELTPAGERKMREYYEGLAREAGQELVDAASEDISTIEEMWDDAEKRAAAAADNLKNAGLQYTHDEDPHRDRIANEKQVEKEYLALIRKNQDAEIALREDGADKERAIAELNYLRQEEALNDMRKLWEEANGGALTDDQISAINTALDLAVRKRDKAFEDIKAKEDKSTAEAIEKERSAINAYLKEYGSFHEKRLAIAKDYAEKIAKANEAGNTFEVASLNEQMKKALSEIDAEEMMDKIDLSSVFSDLGLVLTAPLKETVDQLRKYVQTDKFKNLGVEQQKALYEAIANAEKQLGGMQGLNYKDIGRAVQEYNTALIIQQQQQENLKAAAQKLQEAEAELEKAMQDNDAQAKANAQTQRDAASQEYSKALTNYNNASSKVATSQAKATAQLQKFNNSVSTLENGLKKLYSGELSGLFDLLGPDFANKLGMIVSGGAALQKQADKFIESLASDGKTLEQFAKEAGNAFKTLFNEFSGTLDEAQALASDKLGDLLGDNVGKGLKNELQGQLSSLLSEAFKDGVTPEALELAGEGLSNILSKIGEAGESSGNIWGMIIGLVLQLLDEFKENGIGDIIETLLTNIGDAVNGILENIWKDIITHIVNGIGALLKGILKGIANFFTLGLLSDAIDSWGEHGISDDEIDTLVKSNDALKTAIDELRKTITDSTTTNAEAEDEYKRSREMLEEEISNTHRLMVETAKSWSNGFLGIGGSHSSAHKINKGVSKESWDEISKLLGKNVRSADDFFALTAEEIKQVSIYATSAYGEILHYAGKGYKDASQYIEDYAALAGQLEELEFSFYEKLSGVSWDSFYSDFKSMLKDMDSDAQTFADNFEKYMSDSIIESLANEKYRDRLKELYNKFAYAMGSESEGGASLTEMEIAALKQERENIVNDALDERNRLIEAGLISVKGDDEDLKNAEGSRAAYQTISETTGTVIEGRMASVQVQQRVTGENVAAMRSDLAIVRDNMSEMRGLSLLSINHLAKIEKYTSELPEMNARLGKIEQKIRTV